ncbi:DUF6982 domain-containing protein [Anaeromyxobacter paludicola]|uniref:CheA signal transduction histidine kinase n=1 Tax=Anaeromyxobacter paludicola TaxID=2918171 RepID=A0ABN6NBL3_9BACT|nr:hypothetical protein [Anaeromyxobacter paludicola]BDG09760.1 hypothetical protein AMPC_28730 [Anaeromyxobacter paludicola]
MPEADVLEELRALEVRRAAGGLPPDAEERRTEILAGLEGEALRLERDLARAAARLRLIAEFLPPEVAERALSAAGQASAPLAPEADAPAEPAPAAPAHPAVGEYDADLPPAVAAPFEPAGAGAVPVLVEAAQDRAAPWPPSPLAAMLTPEAALPPPVLDPLPPDAPPDAEPWPRLTLGELPGAPPDAEPPLPAALGPAAAPELALDPSAEPPFPLVEATPAPRAPQLGSYATDLAGCPGEPGAFEPPLPEASGEGEGVEEEPEPPVVAADGETEGGPAEPAPAAEEPPLDALALEALASVVAADEGEDGFPEPDVEAEPELEVVEGEPEPQAEAAGAEPEPELEVVDAFEVEDLLAAPPLPSPPGGEGEGRGALLAEGGPGLQEDGGQPAAPELELEATPSPAEPGFEATPSSAEPDLVAAPSPAAPELEVPPSPAQRGRAGEGAPAYLAAPAPEPEPAGEAAPAAPLDRLVPGEHRVVIHVVDGPVKRGVLVDPDLLAPDLSLRPAAGAPPEPVRSDLVKAVFFMAAPGALPPPPARQKVTVTFRDGRQLAGTSDDYEPGGVGFFLVPADWRSAAERIWIYADAAKEIVTG